MAIRRASGEGHDAVVAVLLTGNRVDPAANSNEAIRLAAATGHSAVVALLLADPRVDPSADCNCALVNAAANGRTSVVQQLLGDARVDLTDSDAGGIAAAKAAGRNHFAVAALFRNDPRMRLIAACESGDLRKIDALLPSIAFSTGRRIVRALADAIVSRNEAVADRLLLDPACGSQPERQRRSACGCQQRQPAAAETAALL